MWPMTNRELRSDLADGSGGAGDGAVGAGAPSSAPSTGAPPSPQGGEGAEGSTDFESIFFDSGGGEATTEGLTATESPQATRPVQPPPVAQQPAQVQPTAQPAVAQPPQQAPAQPQVQQPQTPRAQPEVSPDLDRYDPAQLASAIAANEQQLVEVLAQQALALSPQEIEAIETNVVEAIPRLMARAVVLAQKSALTQMANILPVAIQRHNETMYKAGSAEAQFYQAWPQIDRGRYGQMVYGYGSMLRQMYPQATLYDIIRHVGPMVMQVAGIGALPGAANGSPRVQAPMNRGNGRSPPPSPFTPAAGGSGPVPGSSGGDMSSWEAIFAHQDS